MKRILKQLTMSLPMSTIKLFLVILICSIAFNPMNAQFFESLSNPKVAVQMVHPPGFGLKINKVVFNTATGQCSDQVIDAMISDFVNNKVEVIARENLKSILSEQNFNLSEYVDKNSAMSIGKILGPSALVSVKVLRCQTESKDNLYKDVEKYDAKSKSNYVERVYIAKTTVYLKVSVQTTDLTTGRVFAAQVIEDSPTYESTSTSGRPEIPSSVMVQERAISSIINDFHKLFFSWTETNNLVFYDDKDGGLKDAYKALKVGDIASAFSISKKNLDFCKSEEKIKDKILARAYYNLGIMYFIQNDYDNAITNLLESNKLRSGGIVTDAIVTCRKAKELSESMNKIDEKAAFQVEMGKNKLKQSDESKDKNALSNSDVISLTKNKLPNSLIIQKIKTSTCSFNTSTDALVELTKAGVSEDIIILMMDRK